MSQQFPRATAYHEAGHAVVAWSLSLKVSEVSVSADDASGRAQTTDAEFLPLVEQIALLFYGGKAAEDVFGHPAHEQARWDDVIKIMKLLEDYGISVESGDGHAMCDQGYACACAHLERHRDKVIALAEQLVERGRVNASELRELLGAID